MAHVVQQGGQTEGLQTAQQLREVRMVEGKTCNMLRDESKILHKMIKGVFKALKSRKFPLSLFYIPKGDCFDKERLTTNMKSSRRLTDRSVANVARLSLFSTPARGVYLL